MQTRHAGRILHAEHVSSPGGLSARRSVMHPGTAHCLRSTAARRRADSKAGNPTGAASAPWMIMPGLMRTLTRRSRLLRTVCIRPTCGPGHPPSKPRALPADRSTGSSRGTGRPRAPTMACHGTRTRGQCCRRQRSKRGRSPRPPEPPWTRKRTRRAPAETRNVVGDEDEELVEALLAQVEPRPRDPHNLGLRVGHPAPVAERLGAHGAYDASNGYVSSSQSKLLWSMM